MPEPKLVIVEGDATNAIGFRVDDIEDIVYEERESGDVGTVQLLRLKLRDGRERTYTGANAVSVYNTLKNSFAEGGADAQIEVVVTASVLPDGAATEATLALIADLRKALTSVGLDQIDVNVLGAVLPAGGATAANQATMITSLQLIDNLANALDSLSLDEIDVNVEASVLPTGAATEATQSDALIQLEAIETATSDSLSELQDIETDTSGILAELQDIETDTSGILAAVATAAAQSNALTQLEAIETATSDTLTAITNALDAGLSKFDVDVETSVVKPDTSNMLVELEAIESFTSDMALELPTGLDTSDLEIDDDAVSVGDHGYIGGAWQRNPLLLGYSGDKTQNWTTLPALVGTNIEAGDTVPAGEIWEVQAVSARNDSNISTNIYLQAIVNGSEMLLEQVINPAQSFNVLWSGAIVLSEGDKIQVIYTGCVAGDSLVTAYHAVRIDIDQ